MCWGESAADMLRILNPSANIRALQVLLRALSHYRELLWEMTRRDIVDRQAGFAFSRFWIIGQPMLMMLVYVFVFSFVFTVRLGVDDNGLGYVAFLLAGLVPWLAIQDAIGRAPTCVIENKSLVKQIAFPVEILPVKMVLSTLLLLGIGLVFPISLAVLNGTAKPSFWLLLPLPISSYLLLTIGLSYIIAAVGVFLRDMRNIVQLFLTIGLFAHPILYVPGMLPNWMEGAFQLSPFTHLIWLFRDVVLGEIAHPGSWLIAPILGMVSLSIGYRTFCGLRHMFGDAL
jgi:lipopolysaccharide transport system permease protein